VIVLRVVVGWCAIEGDVDEIPPAPIIYVTVAVVICTVRPLVAPRAVCARLAWILPDVGGNIFVAVIHPRVDDRHNDVSPARLVPGGFGSDLLQPPEVAEALPPGPRRGEIGVVRRPLCPHQIIRLGVIDSWLLTERLSQRFRPARIMLEAS
jgi:hypothetical protein